MHNDGPMNDEMRRIKREQELLAKHDSGFQLLRGRVGLTAQPGFTPNSVQGVNSANINEQRWTYATRTYDPRQA